MPSLLSKTRCERYSNIGSFATEMPNGFPERFLGLPVIGIQFMPEIRANNCILDILP